MEAYELNSVSAMPKSDLTWLSSDTSAWTVMARGVVSGQAEFISAATRSAWTELEA